MRRPPGDHGDHDDADEEERGWVFDAGEGADVDLDLEGDYDYDYDYDYYLAPYDSTACQICAQSDHEDVLMLCDGCDRGYVTLLRG